ncbi:MAG: M16 family metallopeptidase [Phycisphaerae bacterium]
MLVQTIPPESDFVHGFLDSGVELAVDQLPHRHTVAMCFRMLTGVADDPLELTGIAAIVERTLSKGTQNYGGQALADAFDALGTEWAGASGRQSTLLRVVCLPEFALQVVDLVAEMFCRPTFPEEACEVAVQLAQEELRHMEDDPHDLLRADIQRLTLGPIYGRYPGGEPETLARITPDQVRSHWRNTYHAGRLQVAVAGPIDADAFGQRVDACFGGLGHAARDGRQAANYTFAPRRTHRQKDLKQQYIGLTLPGAPKGHADFPIEQVVISVLAGGMSGRLFTEVREKQGLVYWVGAWHEQPRGRGVIHLGASTTPQRCEQTYRTLLRELERLHQDLTEQETERARDGLIAHLETEDALTRARAAVLSDDLFHFSRPVGLKLKLDGLRAVTAAQVEGYVRRLPREQICAATVGPRALAR